MFRKATLSIVGLTAGLAFLASPAQAHRRWLLPSATVLAGKDATVSVDAAASNGLFIFEHRPLGLDDLTITGPDGAPVTANVLGTGEYRSVFDVPLKQQGTYRIALASDGMMGFYEADGERHRWRGTRAQMATAIPANATDVRVFENNSRVETFVTLGAPNTAALKPTGSGIEMIPITHPNDLVVGEPARMRFLVDGKPAANLPVEFVEGGTRYRDDPGVRELSTDADGTLTLQADEPGMYYLEADMASDRQDAKAEGGDKTPRRMSYTAVLEFLPL